MRGGRRGKREIGGARGGRRGREREEGKKGGREEGRKGGRQGGKEERVKRENIGQEDAQKTYQECPH